MGSYTNNYKLFKAASTDFVDVNTDVSNVLTQIDELLWELCGFETNSLAFSNQSVPTYQNKHVYSAWDGGVRVWDNQAVNNQGTNNWQPTHASPMEWQPLASYLVNGWVDEPAFKTYWRYTKESINNPSDTIHIELRGRISLGTGFSAIVLNTNYTIVNGLPGGYHPLTQSQIPGLTGWISLGELTGGNAPASTTVSNYFTAITQSANGITAKSPSSLTITRRAGTTGSSNQTAGSQENYICLDGLIIPLSKSGSLT